MAGRYWDEELETAPWPEVEAWQAWRVAEFVDVGGSVGFAGSLRVVEQDGLEVRQQRVGFVATQRERQDRS